MTSSSPGSSAIKSIVYEKSETVVVIVGYIRSGSGDTGRTGGSVRIGPDRAFHQHWIEEGTDDRRLKKSKLASNLKTMGGYGASYFTGKGFKGTAFVTERMAGNTTTRQISGVVAFVPKDGIIAPVQPQRPMARAYADTRDEVQENAERLLLDALNKATAELRGD
jgi:hypothetical protein